MTLEAPLSRSRRITFVFYIAACVAMALWFAYDGYINRSFIAEHTNEQGKALLDAFGFPFKRAAEVSAPEKIRRRGPAFRGKGAGGKPGAKK